MPVCSEPLVAHPSLAWCLERKIPVGRRPFSQAGRKRSDFLGYHEQSPPPYPPQGPNRPRPRTHLHQMHRSGNVTPTKEKRAKAKLNTTISAWQRAVRARTGAGARGSGVDWGAGGPRCCRCCMSRCKSSLMFIVVVVSSLMPVEMSRV